MAAADGETLHREGVDLLLGRHTAVDPRGAADRFALAAEHGNAEAAAALATLTAAGVIAPPDWARALDLLKQAAAGGLGRARRQLALLAGPDGRIDLSFWFTPPPREILCEAPRIRQAADFAPHWACDWLMEQSRGRFGPGTMYSGETRADGVEASRRCSDYQFEILNTDLVVLLVRERISALTRLPVAAMEPPRVFHYALGEEIKPHYDRVNDGPGRFGETRAYQGDRIATFLLYLNDDFDGGELEFPKVDFRRKGAKGDAIYFTHVDGAGRPDRLSLHAGLPILRGEKWVLSQWIHDRPFAA